MDLFSAVFLGFVQGFTEFLPVSSSAHLTIMPKFFKLTEPSIAYNVALHIATGLAVIVYFGKTIINILLKDKLMIVYLLIGTIPAGFAGIFLEDFFESLFQANIFIGIFLIITGITLYLAEKINIKIESDKPITWFKSLFIGLFQAIAIMPGISRSGITTSAGLFLGIERKKAAQFSFLLSIPAIFGAGLLKAREINQIDFLPLIIGFLASFITGLIAIKIFMKLIENRQFKFFALYCLMLGTTVIILKDIL